MGLIVDDYIVWDVGVTPKIEGDMGHQGDCQTGHTIEGGQVDQELIGTGATDRRTTDAIFREKTARNKYRTVRWAAG